MPVFKVNVKWQKEKFTDIECNTDESPDNFKAMLFSLTGVPPERQKIMMPGKMLSNDSYEGIKLKDGANVMLMGSADEVPPPKPVSDKHGDSAEVVKSFIKQDRIPAGLNNLGNTCYINAVVQVLLTVPELAFALRTMRNSVSTGSNQDSTMLLNSLSDLFKNLSCSEKPVVPMNFVSMVHRNFPQFAVRDSSATGPKIDVAGNDSFKKLLTGMATGGFQQQDANEFWMLLMRNLQTCKISDSALLKITPPDYIGQKSGWNPVDRYFTGTFTSTLTLKEQVETGGDPPSVFSDTFTQLSCFINQEVKYLHTGLKNSLETTLTRKSEILGRDAEFKQINRISRLPAYLSVQFVRFFYKEKEQINAKILKNVAFPVNLDVFELCTEELQAQLKPMREKDAQEKERLVFQAPKNKKSNSEKSDEDVLDPYESPDKFEPYWLADDLGSNNTGLYELQAVLTHQGRSSSSGHYVGWCKKKDRWYKFDDETVSEVTEDQIKNLAGGGDWHCAYILLYGPQRVSKAPATEAAAASKS